MVARYGDFVLYRPPLKATTLLLWAGPALLGRHRASCVLWRILRRRRAREDDRPLTDEERREAERLLADIPREGSVLTAFAAVAALLIAAGLAWLLRPLLGRDGGTGRPPRRRPTPRSCATRWPSSTPISPTDC